MAVITIGTTGAVWGVTAETGIICQTVSTKAQREKNMVRNESGDVTLVSYYNPSQTFTISGIFTSASGIAAAAPGVALTVANTNNPNASNFLQPDANPTPLLLKGYGTVSNAYPVYIGAVAPVPLRPRGTGIFFR